MSASARHGELPIVALESERKALSGLEQTFQTSKPETRPARRS